MDVARTCTGAVNEPLQNVAVWPGAAGVLERRDELCVLEASATCGGVAVGCGAL